MIPLMRLRVADDGAHLQVLGVDVLAVDDHRTTASTPTVPRTDVTVAGLSAAGSSLTRLGEGAKALARFLRT